MIRRPHRNNPPPHKRLLSTIRSIDENDIEEKRHSSGTSWSLIVRWVGIGTIMVGIVILLMNLNRSHTSPLRIPTNSNKIDENRKKRHFSTSTNCSFRRYPPHRYFKLNERPLPSFLSETKYIYGEFPTLLPISDKIIETKGQQKLCVDQSSWLKPVRLPTSSSSANTPTQQQEQRQQQETLPFADGTNPSILRIQNNPNLHLPIDFGPDAMYLTTICMTNSQCAWKDSPKDIQEYHISQQSEPSTVRTILFILDSNFQVLEETTIMTRLDAPYGKMKSISNTYAIYPLDDARLFTYQKELWVSYRDGPNFGYEKQVLNRIHLTRTSSTSSSTSAQQQQKGEGTVLQATLMASEIDTLCCGRNMALFENVYTHQLQALTWVDPVTVVNVNVREKQKQQQQDGPTRRLLEIMDNREQQQRPPPQLLDISADRDNHSHRRLSSKGSDFHGTNGFMVHLPKTKEYIGIGHFHRPPGRKANEYARFGHHYTHAFFTISDQEPYILKRLSPELLLPSSVSSSDAAAADGEIIQFWSGLERHYVEEDDDDDDGVMALAYGINDCEGAATYINMKTIDSLLREVSPGMEVLDLLEPLKNI